MFAKLLNIWLERNYFQCIFTNTNNLWTSFAFISMYILIEETLKGTLYTLAV